MNYKKKKKKPESQFDDIRNKITEQNKHFAKETETKKEPNGNSETEEVNKWSEEPILKNIEHREDPMGERIRMRKEKSRNDSGRIGKKTKYFKKWKISTRTIWLNSERQHTDIYPRRKREEKVYLKK